MGAKAPQGTSGIVHAVRKHILEILKETGGATVAELADRLEMAPVSVRHHLDILQGDGLICIGRVERTGSVGRPPVDVNPTYLGKRQQGSAGGARCGLGGRPLRS